MLSLLYGTDEEKKKAELARRQAPLLDLSLVVVHLDDISFNEYSLNELIGAQGLFGERYIVTLFGLLEKSDTREKILPLLQQMADSANHFFVIEKDLKKEFVTKFEKAKAEVHVFLKKADAKERFNVFAITDAFGARDRKRTWSLYIDALGHDIDPREISGILFWAIKNMLVVARLPKGKETATLSGLSPFVFQKARMHAKNFTLPELEKISSDLVGLYHDGQFGSVSFPEAIESFLLRVV